MTDEISLCENCFCMTHSINGNCAKCKNYKFDGTNKTTAMIERDPNGHGLWLSINHALMDGVAWAITEDEVPIILEACKKWLKEAK